MPKYVPRLLLDQERRFEDIAFGAIFRLDDRQFTRGVVPEQVFEELIQPRRILYQSVGRAAFVKDRHGGAVQFGVLEQVFVDEVAENLACLFLFMAEDGRARKADGGRIGQSPAQVAM